MSRRCRYGIHSHQDPPARPTTFAQPTQASWRNAQCWSGAHVRRDPLGVWCETWEEALRDQTRPVLGVIRSPGVTLPASLSQPSDRLQAVTGDQPGRSRGGRRPSEDTERSGVPQRPLTCRSFAEHPQLNRSAGFGRPRSAFGSILRSEGFRTS